MVAGERRYRQAQCLPDQDQIRITRDEVVVGEHRVDVGSIELCREPG
jgi:hypothetical protein